MNRTLVLILVLVLGLVVLFFALRPAPPATETPDTPASTEPQELSVDLEIRDSAMTPSQVAADEGDQLTLNITSDRPVEFHLHGYDLEAEVSSDEGATLSFEANLTGRFEIEDEQTQEELGTLIVVPR